MKTFNMRGCNVTMPDKVEAAKYMDELSPAAQIIGAVNTIVNDNGKLIGHITDGEGFVHNLRDHGIEIKGKKITVAGGGGAATAIQVQCALDGAREISIFNIKDAFFERTLQTAEKIKKAKLLREAKKAGCTCVGGKGMLLWQGVAAFKLYTGQDMPVEDVKKLFFS